METLQHPDLRTGFEIASLVDVYRSLDLVRHENSFKYPGCKFCHALWGHTSYLLPLVCPSPPPHNLGKHAVLLPHNFDTKFCYPESCSYTVALPRFTILRAASRIRSSSDSWDQEIAMLSTINCVSPEIQRRDASVHTDQLTISFGFSEGISAILAEESNVV